MKRSKKNLWRSATPPKLSPSDKTVLKATLCTFWGFLVEMWNFMQHAEEHFVMLDVLWATFPEWMSLTVSVMKEYLKRTQWKLGDQHVLCTIIWIICYCHYIFISVMLILHLCPNYRAGPSFWACVCDINK